MKFFLNFFSFSGQVGLIPRYGLNIGHKQIQRFLWMQVQQYLSKIKRLITKETYNQKTTLLSPVNLDSGQILQRFLHLKAYYKHAEKQK